MGLALHSLALGDLIRVRARYEEWSNKLSL